jgi:hypothetical protein
MVTMRVMKVVIVTMIFNDCDDHVHQIHDEIIIYTALLWICYKFWHTW